ncbi:MAG TPA: MFS transporter [Burkholderiales bacterium]|nr:MFS transporter [Burkholderiales bacterium]
MARLRPRACRALRAEPHELPALGWAFAYFFILLCSYYLLRPVRDSLAVESGTRALQWLFTATFAVMLALVPVFGWLCARLPRAKLLPAVYGFFAANLALFCVRLDGPLFFVWLSVFNLFVVSVFWSFMSDLFTAAQAARLYGTIAAGGSCGAVAGPLVAATLADTLHARGLLALSGLLLIGAVACIAMLGRWARAHPRPHEPPPAQAIGGSVIAGARAALSSPFLLAISAYLLCYTVLSTALYFQQVEIVRAELPDAAERTRLFASVDLVVNALTLALQVFGFARLSLALGAGGMLAVAPIVSIAGFSWLGASPTLAALVGFGVARRVSEFAIARPAREALFTVVPREARYKAKNFIDTVVYRGGDAFAGWALGGLPAIAALAAGLSAGWLAVALYLGARMKAWTREDAPSSAPSPRWPPTP